MAPAISIHAYYKLAYYCSGKLVFCDVIHNNAGHTPGPAASSGWEIVYANQTLLHDTSLTGSQLVGKTPDALLPPEQADRLVSFYQRTLHSDAGQDMLFAFDGPWGRRVTDMFGLSRDAVLKDASVLLDRIHPDDQQRVFAGSLETAITLKPWHCEFRMLKPDGEIAWLSAHDLPQRLKDETVIWTGYAEDITEKKQLEESLRISEALYRNLAASDVVGRLGGDEFLVLLGNPGGRAKALAIGNKLCEALAQPFQLSACVASISACVGVALYPDHGDSPEALINAADDAMYAAKSQGRNQTQMAVALMPRQEGVT